MAIPRLEQTLHTVPFLHALGVRVDESRPGEILLALPASPENVAHGGSVHTGAIYTLAETAAKVAVSTHPVLASRRLRQKSTKAKYYSSTKRDITARATITAEVEHVARDALATGQEAVLEIAVRVLDAKGIDIAEVTVKFTLG